MSEIQNQSSMGVAIRIRPLNSKETSRGDTLCWKPNDDASSLVVPDEATTRIKTLKNGQALKLPKFRPESVFGSECSTTDVYNAVGKHVVNGSLRGINGTILAYGQTSSGKTHTMLGDQTCPGVVLLAVRDIFQHISENEEREWFLRVSMVEIYNEVVADLLQKGNDHLGVFSGKDGRDVIIKGVHEEIVTSANQVWDLLETGFQNRSVSGTDMNAVSSRSHTVFRMVIESRAIGADINSKVRVSSLNMVDLAGSERMAHAGTGGGGKKQRRNEGININKSLLTLGAVIKQLMKQAARGTKQHIQYRNSMLTRVLAKSIGGSAQTAVICTLAPSHVYYADSKITLGFAANACRVKVKARVNDIKAKNAMLGLHEEEMAKLKNELKRWPMGRPEGIEGAAATFVEDAATKEEREAKQEQEVEARTEQVKHEYQEKLAHLQSLILRATGGEVEGQESVTNQIDGSKSLLSISTPGRTRDTWGPGQVRQQLMDRHRRASLGGSNSLSAINEAEDEDDDDNFSGQQRSSSSSVVSVAEDMSHAEAMDEIRNLKERLAEEEEDLFYVDTELFKLTQDYKLLTEGSGIEKKSEEELDHMSTIYEEGMVRVLKERHRKQMMAKENELRAEVERLKIQLLNERETREAHILEKTTRLTTENIRLTNEAQHHAETSAAYKSETSVLREEMKQQKEEHERTVTLTKNQVFEHEKLLRAERCFKGMTPVKNVASETMYVEEVTQENEHNNESLSISGTSSNISKSMAGLTSGSINVVENTSQRKGGPKKTPRRVSRQTNKSTPLRAAFGFGK
jgi:centromeric protein E